MQPDNYKPKTTIIQANPGFWHKGEPVVAWVIEDGQVTKPVVLGAFDYAYDPQPFVRGTDE
jgi:hypothetical protein